MTVSELVSQTWTLTKKDLLLVARRRWFSTFIRAVAFPIVLTVILASVKNWIHNNGGYGIGEPSPIRTLPEAFDAVGSQRPNFVIVDRGLPGEDVKFVIDQLSSMARDGNRNVQMVKTSDEITNACPSSSKGVSRIKVHNAVGQTLKLFHHYRSPTASAPSTSGHRQIKVRE